MARKKIIFVIVEGPSDEQALGVVLSKLYDPNKVFVQIMHCDITTKWGVTPDNILSNIGGIVREYARNNSFKKNDFKEIIHIVDTDGAPLCQMNLLWKIKQQKKYCIVQQKSGLQTGKV